MRGGSGSKRRGHIFKLSFNHACLRRKLGDTNVHNKFYNTLTLKDTEACIRILIMDNDKKNYRVTDGKGLEEYDHGFDQFLNEEEIDIKTFVLPPRPRCGICTLPFPLEANRTMFKQCCGNMVCRACDELTVYGELKRRIEEEPHTSHSHDIWSMQKCQFCREMPPTTIKVSVYALEKLAECGNGRAMFKLANLYKNGGEGVPINHKRSIELHHMAARAGNSPACGHLGRLYLEGKTFDDIFIEKSRDKARRLFTRGTRLGDPRCLFCLGIIRCKDGKDDYAQYLLKAASAGVQEGLDYVKKLYMEKIITKGEYAYALRSFQSADDEINNEERKRFNKRLAAHQTLDYFDLMSKDRLIEVLNEVVGSTEVDYFVLDNDTNC